VRGKERRGRLAVIGDLHNYMKDIGGLANSHGMTKWYRLMVLGDIENAT